MPKPLPAPRRGICGFTLVEILVVVGILMLLSAIVFTVVASSKSSAYASVEASQVRQLYVAINLYEEDFDRQAPKSLVDLSPTYVKPSMLECPRDVRHGLALPDWPANPWVNFPLVDPPAVMQRRFPSINSYLYLGSFSSRFANGRTFAELREEPRVGLIVGVGLLKCDSNEQHSGCFYPIQLPEIDRGQPAINLAGTLLTIRTDGSVKTRFRKSPVSSIPSYEALFLFYSLNGSAQRMDPG